MDGMDTDSKATDVKRFPDGREKKELLVKAAKLDRLLQTLQKKLLESSDTVAASARSAQSINAAKLSEASPALSKKRASEETSLNERSGVIYLGHVPHGFYEDEMKGFFSQFGRVTNVRLSRSKKTGGSKGYAFVEFADTDVARIAAKAMDSYLMGGKQLVCRIASAEFVANRPRLFNGVKRRPVRGSRTKLDSRVASYKSFVKAQRQKQSRIKNLGIQYELPVAKKKKAIRDHKESAKPRFRQLEATKK